MRKRGHKESPSRPVILVWCQSSHLQPQEHPNFFKQNKPYKLNVLSNLNTLHDGLLNLQKSSRKRTNFISGAEEVWRLDWRGQGSRYQTGAPGICVSTIKGKSELQARRQHCGALVLVRGSGELGFILGCAKESGSVSCFSFTNWETGIPCSSTHFPEKF